MSDAAASLLAERVGFTFTRSGRVLGEDPSPTLTIVLVMASSAIREIDWAAYEVGVDRNVYINIVLAEALGVDFNPTGSV